MRSIAIARAAIALSLPAALLAPGPPPSGRAAEVRVEWIKLLDAGVSAYNRGLYAEAVDRLGRCTAIALNSFRAHYYYGLALDAARRYAEAIEALGVALDLEPTNLEAWVALGDSQLALGDLDEARAAYAQALRLRPAHPPALDGLGRAAEARADDEGAIDYFRQAVLSNEGYAPAYTHLGDLYLRKGRLREAVRLLEEAVTLRPEFTEGLNRLALAYGRLGLYAEAVATVQKASAIDPSDPFSAQTLGWLLLDQGLLAAAQDAFERALALEPQLPESRIGLAQLRRRRGDYAGAIREIASALELTGLGASTIGRLEALRPAIEAEARRAAELEARVAAGDGGPEDHAELADLLARRGAWAAAATHQRRAPPSPEGAEWLAYLLVQDGQYREAHGIYSRLAAGSGDLDLRLNAGVALALLGRDAAAALEFEAILATDPAHALARLYLANAQLRLGRIEVAAASYRAFLDGGGPSESAERVRRILKQIAPELAPLEQEPLVPPAPPPRPRDEPPEAAP